MENQSPDFNTLSSSLVFRLRVDKGCMRHTTSPAISLGIKALDKCHQIRCLPVSIIPLDIGIGFHRICLSLTVGVYEFDGHKITLRDRMRVCHRQRIFQNSFDWTPDVDDLVSALEELGGIFGEMEGDSALGRIVRLVDMHPLNWSTELVTNVAVTWSSANSVVKDKDTRGTRAM